MCDRLVKAQGPQTGVTLIELLVTLAIATIVLTLGVVGFRELVASTKITNAANSLVGHLQFARSEAIKRGTEVSVCPSTDGTTCVSESDGSWEIGYLVRLDATGRVLRYVDSAEMAGITVTMGKPRIRFRPDGTAPGFNATLTICDTTDSAAKRGVIVSDVGRVRVSNYRAGGGALSCP